MKPVSTLKKATSFVMAACVLTSVMVPSTAAYAHDPYNYKRHNGHGEFMTQRAHKKFHKRYGYRDRGHVRYKKLHTHHRKSSNRSDLIAAGILGLAIGAIIANEKAKSSGNYAQPTYRSLDTYNTGPSVSQGQTGSDYPQVITFDETNSLEPWTPGWEEWCTNRYRSFNINTGTYRGYDGLDHFCVPK